MPRQPISPSADRFFSLGTLVLVVAILYFAQTLFIPLALSALLCFLLAPMVTFFERKGLHRAASITLVTSTVLIVVTVLGWVVVGQIEQLVQQLPNYQENIITKLRAVRSDGHGSLDRAAEAVKHVTQELAAPTTAPATAPNATTNPTNIEGFPSPASSVTEPASEKPMLVRIADEQPSPLKLFFSNVSIIFSPLATAGIVVVFTLFMLVQRSDLRDRVIRLLGQSQLQLTTEALDEGATRISRFLVAQAIVNGSFGAAISLGLAIIGWTLGGGWFPSFILWGFLCATLRFIPYIGPWAAAAFPILLSFAVYPGYSVFAAVLTMFIVIELLSNNLMEPWLYGSSTGMSTLAVIVSAVFWTWIWGPIGLILATPLTVCLVVIGKYVPQLDFLDVLLSDQPALDPPQRLYQRLLAKDPDEAFVIAEQFHEGTSLEMVYEQMILPALSMSEQSRHSGRLDEDRAASMRLSFRELIEQLAEDDRALPSDAENGLARRPRLPQDCKINVICLPAHDDADEVAGLMLAKLLELRGFCVTTVSQTALASEMMEKVNQSQATLVCVSALPPAAIAHARYLCKRLDQAFPKMKTVLGLWTTRADLSRARNRITCKSETQITTTLTSALEQIGRISEGLAMQTREKPAGTGTT